MKMPFSKLYQKYELRRFFLANNARKNDWLLVTPRNEVKRDLFYPSVTLNEVKGLNHWRREKVPSSNSTQKRLYAFGEKLERG